MTHPVDPTRRSFLAASGGLALAAVTSSTQAADAPATALPSAPPAALTPLPAFVTRSSANLLPRGKARRVVICGGGWGGVTAARYMRERAPQMEVVLLERNPVFISGPMSNKWLIDVVNTDYISHDYLDAAERFGYRFIQTEVSEIDRDNKRVHTALGHVDYDYLIVAPGIRYNYEAWFGNDRELADVTRQRYPSAYMPNNELFRLKRALHEFKGGDLVMNLPPPPQRCPPSPYERACLIASLFKQKKNGGRVIILDHKDGARPIGPGYMAAFRELYGDIITYVPNARIQELDPHNKKVKTAAGDFSFEHAIFMAPHQAGDLAWKAGIVKSPSIADGGGWADVDPVLYTVRGDDSVYVVGDAVGFTSPQFRYFPKAAHVANRQARIVAGYIAEREADKEPTVVLPDNLCYMLVNPDPQEGISVQFDYRLDDNGLLHETQVDYNERSAETVGYDFEWARIIYKDMFG